MNRIINGRYGSKARVFTKKRGYSRSAFHLTSPDSVVVASYLEKFSYRPEEQHAILSKYEAIIRSNQSGATSG